MVTGGQRLCCLGTDGRARWQTPTETAEAVAPVVGDERVCIAGWGHIVVLERRNGDMVWEGDCSVHERPTFDGDCPHVVRRSFRALDSATGEEQQRYDPEEIVSAASAVSGTVYIGTGRGSLVALNRIGDDGLSGGRERWSISLDRNVDRSLAATDRRILCSLVRDDSLPNATVVADVDESSTGMIADVDRSES